MYISSERSDVQTLIPLLKRMESGFDKRHATIVADADYESLVPSINVRIAAAAHFGQTVFAPKILTQIEYWRSQNLSATAHRNLRKNHFAKRKAVADEPLDPVGRCLCRDQAGLFVPPFPHAGQGKRPHRDAAHGDGVRHLPLALQNPKQSHKTTALYEIHLLNATKSNRCNRDSETAAVFPCAFFAVRLVFNGFQ